MSKFFGGARAAVLGVVSRAVPRCTAQASSTCAGVLPTRAANRRDDRVIERAGPDPVAQWRETPRTRLPFSSQNRRSFRLREVGMGFDLDRSRLDPLADSYKGRSAFRPEVGQSDGPALAPIHEALHRLPRLSSRVTAVVVE